MVKKFQVPVKSKSSPWYVVLTTIVLILGALAGIAYGIYKVVKYMHRKGKCVFKQFTPDSSLDLRASSGDGNMVQTGYITCSGGGVLWTDKKIAVTNNGPGIFYIGPLPNSNFPEELDPKDKITLKISEQAPNVYYEQGSSHTTPHFTVAAL